MKKSVLTKLDRYYLIECIMNKPEDIDIDYHFELIEKLILKERECDEVDEREREKLIVQGMKLIVYGLKSWKIGKEREIYRINREDNKI